jgi:phosphomannomutase
MLPTPAIENAVREFNCDGGIIITASHNEPEYNGFKFLDNDTEQDSIRLGAEWRI